MPIRIKKYYTELPQNKSYLVSNYGEVIKFSTRKKLSVINGMVRLTINGVQTTLSVPKLLRELFVPFNIPITSTENKNFTAEKVKTVTKTIKVATIKRTREVTVSKPTTWREKLHTNPPQTVKKYSAEIKNNEPISKYNRSESFLTFINRLRDSNNESSLSNINDAADWYEKLLATYLPSELNINTVY